ncbi:DUF262 domain-containing protein [Photobacterium sp. NCIMB 13483]|nr:DUF262 domain-containing protein [Photobacterium sp. NCIMB 13483]
MSVNIMQFDDVLNYLEQMVGLDLQSLNGSNDPLRILDVDRVKGRYIIDKTSSTNKRSRSFSELRKVWDVLSQKGFVSVEQALNGAGTSRHQPETILANLPNVEHFKYDKKKHLYLRSKNTHEIGCIKELTIAESKELKKRIDHYRDFDISFFHLEHRRILTSLRENLANIFQKYPGEAEVDTVEVALDDLGELQEKLAISVVTLDSTDILDEGQSMSGRNYEEDEVDEEYQEFFGKYEDKNEEPQYLVATRISQVFPTVSLLFDRINHDEIDLQPEFQRKDRIWPKKDKSRLIESILLGLPIPVFYFAENSDLSQDIDWIVIDGLQRTTTLYDYMSGVFALEHLDRRSDLNNKFFKDLPRREQRRIREYQISGHLIQVSNESDEMVRELFQRINTSGKNLSYQEIRSALYPGTANKFLKFVAESPEFLNATPLSINPERMLDLEYVLRVISYMYSGFEDFQYKKYDDFLCNTLVELNRYDFGTEKGVIVKGETYIDIFERIKNSFETIKSIFGNEAYRKEPTGKLNKPLFELLVSVFAMMDSKQRSVVSSEDIAPKIREHFYKMIKNDSSDYGTWSSAAFEDQDRGFDYSISNSTGKAVTIQYRFESFINMINTVSKIDFKFKSIK